MSLALLVVASGALSLPASVCSTVVATELGRPARRGAIFSARSVENIELGTTFRRTVPGDHLMEFKLYTPSGHLYQVLTVPFSGAASGPRPRSGAAAERKVSGYPRPLAVQTLAPTRTAKVTSRVPVAGTWITTNSLYGRWRVDAHLDSSVTPCASRPFTITR